MHTSFQQVMLGIDYGQLSTRMLPNKTQE